MALIHVADSHDITEARGILRVALAHTATVSKDPAGRDSDATDPGDFGCGEFALYKPERQPGRRSGERASLQKRTARDVKWFVHIFKMAVAESVLEPEAEWELGLGQFVVAGRPRPGEFACEFVVPE